MAHRIKESFQNYRTFQTAKSQKDVNIYCWRPTPLYVLKLENTKETPPKENRAKETSGIGWKCPSSPEGKEGKSQKW